MKSLNILRLLVLDAALNCAADTGRDWMTIQSRVDREGLSFLTITLPRFSSWLEQSLEEGAALPTILPFFHRKSGKYRSLPAFLWGLTVRIFDPTSGLLREDADPSAVYFIRQICSFLKKVKLPCTERRNEAAISKFLETDVCLPKNDRLDTIGQSVANVIVRSLKFSEQDFSEVFPRHGPGATFEKLWGNQKYKGRDYYSRWMGVIDAEELYGMSAVQSVDNSIRYLSPRDESPCRLSLVPKTLKSPRTIAVEPVAMQYAQQLVSNRLMASMRTSAYTKHLDFADQAKNRTLALQGSLTGDKSTIDLSEASDRISCSLVREIVRSDQLLSKQLFAVRTSKIQIRSRGATTIHLLRKYSTSGSAVTFPVETLVFFILSVTALVRTYIASMDMLSAIRRAASEVSVYGDDIVAPSTACASVIQELEMHNLKVNREKTFSKGLFRESCGGDYFRGHDVTPKYLRQLPPESRDDISSFASTVSTCNQLFLAGCWIAADGMKKAFSRLYSLPLVKRRRTSTLGWNTFQDAYEFSKHRDVFGGYRVRTWVVHSPPEVNILRDMDGLLKHHISSGVQEDENHYVMSIRQFTSTLRQRWTSPC